MLNEEQKRRLIEVARQAVTADLAVQPPAAHVVRASDDTGTDTLGQPDPRYEVADGRGDPSQFTAL